MAIYPNGYFSWTNRVDLVDIDYAEDINAVAQEMAAAEKVLGENPQIEKSPVAGTAITYNSADARISDVNAGNQMPVCSLSTLSNSIYVQSGAAVYNTYYKSIDTHGMFNGQDITILADGWYHVYCAQAWAGVTIGSGWTLMAFYINGDFRIDDIWRWDIPNKNLWPFSEGDYAGHNKISWAGALHQGDRLRVKSVNGTYINPVAVSSATLKVDFKRKLTNFVSG